MLWSWRPRWWPHRWAPARPPAAGTRGAVLAGTGTARPAAARTPAQVAGEPALVPSGGQRVGVQVPDRAALAAAKAGRADGTAPSAQSLAPGSQAVWAGVADGPSPLATTAGPTFTGITDDGWEPPDEGLAAGPTDLVQSVNSAWVATNKAGAREFNPITLASWFSNVSNGITFIFDPVVVYRGGHFYHVALAQRDSTLESRILVSVSRTSAGNGAWCNYAFNGLTGSGSTLSWADFPQVGVTSNALFIATNQFTFPASTGSFTGAQLLVINKSQLDACIGAASDVWTNFRNSDNSLAFTLSPAVDYDAFGASAAYLVNGRFPSGTGMNIWRLNSPLPGTTHSFSIFRDVASGSYSTPPDAPQPGTATRIATNDARVLHTAKRYNVLWVSQNTNFVLSSTNTAAAHIVKYNAPASTTGTPTFAGSWYLISGSTTSAVYYPSATPDGNGNMVLGYNYSSTTVNPRIYARGILAGAWQPPVLVAGSCACTNTTGRYGDYSAIALDPVNQSKAWFGGELMAGNNVWKTTISQIGVQGDPIAPQQQ